MPFGELKNLNLNKVLPMFPDRSVTHVPGLDLSRTAPSRSRLGNSLRWNEKAGPSAGCDKLPMDALEVQKENRP